MPTGRGLSVFRDGGLGVMRRHATPLFAAVLCLSLAIRIHHLGTVPYRLGADEGIYLHYARVVGHEGLQTLPSLTAAYLKNEPGLWPPPTRVGYIVPAALAMRILGDGTPQSLTYVSTLMFAALVALAFWFVRRNAPPEVALLTGALMAFSPLLAGLSRRAISDTTVAFLALALLASFHELVVRERRLAAIPFGAALACLLLTKETALLQLPVLLALGLAVTYRRGFVAPAILASAVGASVAAVAAAGALLVAVAGGPARLLELVPHLLRSPASNVYVIDHFGGPWYRFAVDAVVLSPLPTLLAVGFAFHYVAGRRASAADELVDFVGLFALFTLGLHMALALQTGGYALGVRQLLPLEFALCLFAACGLLAFHAGAPGRLSRWVPVAGCALAMLQGTMTFQRAFVTSQLYDPNTPATMAALGFLPTGPEDAFACWSRDPLPPPAAKLSDEELMKRGFDAIYTRNNGAEAESYLRALLARVPTHYGALYQLAVALETCGRIAESRPLWRMVLAIAERTNDQETAKGARDRLAAHDW